MQQILAQRAAVGKLDHALPAMPKRLDEVDILAQIAKVADIIPGQCFIREGDPAAHYVLVTAGSVRVFKALPDGRRAITGFAGPGDFLGLAALDCYATTAEAINAVQIVRYKRLDMAPVLAAFPALATLLLVAAASELVAAQAHMMLLGRMNAREKLAAFLMGRVVARNRDVALPLARVDLADYLGLTVETISRAFGALKRDGMIVIHNAASITICDYLALKALASGADPRLARH
ncbi:MAG: helix-turn-helix domain-containing protein [Acetobacteraceae bacterium]|nr:helix-turn-helix domain-containing protein [Acetobacteraceae bacterium]